MQERALCVILTSVISRRPSSLEPNLSFGIGTASSPWGYNAGQQYYRDISRALISGDQRGSI